MIPEQEGPKSTKSQQNQHLGKMYPDVFFSENRDTKSPIVHEFPTKIAPLVWVFPHFPAPNLDFPVRWPQLERSHFQRWDPLQVPSECWDLKFRTTVDGRNPAPVDR